MENKLVHKIHFILHVASRKPGTAWDTGGYFLT